MPSKLDQLQQQFRQRLDQQKEEKLSSIRIYNDNQQKVLDRVSINNRNSNTNLNDGLPHKTASTSISPTGGLEMRKMNFSQHHPPARKHGSGVDRSRPLKPMPMKPTVGNLNGKEHSQLNGSGLRFGDSSSSATSSNMVLGNHRTTTSMRPPAQPLSPTSVSSAPSSSGVRLNRSQQPPVSQTKVEVKKTGSGNKMIQTTTKPNEVVKVTVETIKKNTPANTVTTVKTTIHKRTIVPARSAPATKNGSTSSTKTSTTTTTASKNGAVPASLRSGISSASVRNGTSPPFSASANSAPVVRKPLSSLRSSSSNHFNSNNHASNGSASPSKARGPVSRAPPADPNMAQCGICSRSFNNDRIEKHTAICQKTSVKKRKPFDVTKMRVKGTEAEQFVKRGAHKREDPKPKKSNWRTKHEEFIESIRQAKIVQKHLEAGGKLSDLPPPKPSENPDYVPCPHCGRKFNEGAAERHIPKCKNISSNKKTSVIKKK